MQFTSERISSEFIYNDLTMIEKYKNTVLHHRTRGRKTGDLDQRGYTHTAANLTLDLHRTY